MTGIYAAEIVAIDPRHPEKRREPSIQLPDNAKASPRTRPRSLQVTEGTHRAGLNFLSLERSKAGLLSQEIGVFVRSESELDRAVAAVKETGMAARVLDDQVETASGQVSIGTMHLAKGLEFRAVVVMACDDEVIPLQSRIEAAAEDSDLEEVYNTERHLLYVACTRARDNLLVTGTDPSSEFLADLRTP